MSKYKATIEIVVEDPDPDFSDMTIDRAAGLLVETEDRLLKEVEYTGASVRSIERLPEEPEDTDE